MTVRVILSRELLSPDELAEINRLLEIADIKNLASADEPQRIFPDQFLYTIVVETSQYTQRITLYEHQVTDELRPLIRFLTRKAKRTS